MIRTISLLLVLTLLAAAPARADEVQLKNGDRLTGTTVSLARGVLTFATPYGDVRLPWAEVTRLTVDDQILIAVAGAAPVEVTIGAAAAAGQVTLQPGGIVALTDIASLGFVTTLRHDLDYDKSPAVGRRSTDRTFALTLGYRF